MSSNINTTLTNEQLFACLEYDGINVHVDTINKAKNNDGQALRHIGVSRDYFTAMEYFLKAVRGNTNVAIFNIGFAFLNGDGVLVDTYKALEWSIKIGKENEEVKKLNQEGIHFREEDKNKTIYQLVDETDYIVREERMERESKLKEGIAELRAKESKSKGESEELKKAKSSSEQEMENLRKEYQTLQIESQEKHASSEQHLKDKDEVIKALHLTTDTLQSLIQSKTNENNVLNKDIQRLNELEQTNRELNCKLQEYRKVIQESISLRGIVDYEIVTTNNSAKNKNDANINTKDEEI